MEQETTILKSDTGEFLLTDRKVRFTIKNWGQINVKSIMLDKISSIEMKSRSTVMFLALALAAIVLGYTSGIQNGSTYGIVFGVLFVVFYFMTIKRVVIISSPSSSIFLSVKKVGNKKAIEFMDQLENQIHTYKNK